MRVALLIVSHSAKLADGVVELAGQMAPDVTILAAGGMDDGGLGTSLGKIGAAIATAGDSGMLILTDLGSAVMTAEAALDLAGGPAGVQLADAPLVEGAVAAAVAAQAGAGLPAVRAAAETALTGSALGIAPPGAEPAPAASGSDRTIRADAVLLNPMGLHARPAATLAAALGAMNVEIEINGVDGQSVMMLMTLGAAQGTELHIVASGPDAQRAVDLVRTEVANGFGEI
ncbi:dihydroxyacetone kinase phosphoryl donor subunit DhaM [Arthrobacter russicus]|uniref:Phosphocarrier protein HPr n=1 Tax=Arthrobacter russicus TaxID=172040 RepID=A0ABU1JAY9_9MICC|nr:dihydroxyacetone kinase phosphoryl donor subunit DhaM [Arthrobacter russicus]MDN5669051.1 PTS-dependent dihydroxyacetone kinase phosphotransferase subunit DhaM [Renibacterium salmoninarum]MDR6269588.1 PTS hybrid protein [Arthrobacter russicus]